MKKNNFLPTFLTAFGSNGLVALAWFYGAIHADEIMAEIGFFPVLEISGQPGSGKTALMSTINKTSGLAHDELDCSSVILADIYKHVFLSSSPVCLNVSECDQISMMGMISVARFKKAIALLNYDPLHSRYLLLNGISIYMDLAYKNRERVQAYEELINQDNILIFDPESPLSAPEIAMLKEGLFNHAKALKTLCHVTQENIIANHALLLTLIDIIRPLVPGLSENYQAVQHARSQVSVMAKNREFDFSRAERNGGNYGH